MLSVAFETDATDPYLPHNYERNTVVYTGTHDNNTTPGWFESATERERANVLDYLDVAPDGNNSGAELAWRLARLGWGSVADLAIVPLQDLLGLGRSGSDEFPRRDGQQLGLAMSAR